MGKIAQAARSQESQIEKRRPNDVFADNIKRQWPKIMAVAPKSLTSDRLFQMTISAVNREPKLMQCDFATVLSCVMKCSALGLEPSAVDGLGRAYILPFRNKGRMEATFVLGYKGMLELARRSGEIQSVSARAVYEGDEFEYEFGLDERCRHVPGGGPKTPDKLTHVYAVAKFVNGGHYLEVMTRSDIDAVRKTSKAKDSGPWASDFEAMARKSAVRRAFPYLPVSIEAQDAAASDETDGGFADALDGMVDVEPVVPADEASAAPDGAEEDKGLAGLATEAVCANCGNVVSEVAADATAQDLDAGMACCESPSYELR